MSEADQADQADRADQAGQSGSAGGAPAASPAPLPAAPTPRVQTQRVPTPEDLAEAPPEGPRLGRPPGAIERDDLFAVAARKAMWPHVQRLLELDAALRDPEGRRDLKKYRVATRRLRAALKAFEEAFPKREVRDLRDDLGDLATTAGAARDLDVRIADVVQWSLERGGEAPDGVKPLVAAWQAERADAASRLDARLRTRRHRRLMEDLAAFVEASDAPGRRATGQAPTRPIGLQAGSLVWDSYERLLTYDRVIRWADLATLHQLRIEAKRLRYLLEFLGDILGPERTDLIARLVAVQDHFGLLNDAVVNSMAVRAFLQEPSTQLQPAERTAVTTYLQEREREIGRLRRGAGRPWRPVAGVTFARRLARTIAAR
jgi:CHAD domain-containing protein